ncbi:metabotropic glutamate receptor 2-like [Mya arenaria]|uniref:metabotropic glutamate receptor 2-like n=1 Tax=Mya arenaria TaxID=6604 RepID=UPI0022E8B72E|nr:metabotropic glutamate receptor 2-like [Mya arenaria]XP_052781594.1 metabotropic glutamate receptor 2-like [Mya arenaria]XP_052781595.1 metabotropic glutamate receptor 2-like [Mya arenaria]XP_052781596.1 metabotropic glutamate receptor 2-like [Mya arenaria]
MSSTSLTTFITVFFIVFLTQQLVHSNDLDPVLTSPGDHVILVFIDIHGEFQDGACSGWPDWVNYERAHFLYWKSLADNNTGIEIYDSCGSERRVATLLRNRLYDPRCENATMSIVTGILSYSTAKVDGVISSFTDVLHVSMLDKGRPTVEEDYIVADIPVYSNIQILGHVLKSLNWDYVATAADDRPISQAEHSAFLKLADDLGICVRYSQTIANISTDNIGDVTTPGIIVFLNKKNLLDNLNIISNGLAADASVIIVTHDKETDSLKILQTFKNIKKAVILTDDWDKTMEEDNNFADYVTLYLNETFTEGNSLLATYFSQNFNCTLNETEEKIRCADVGFIDKELFRSCGIDRFHSFGDVYKVMSQASVAMASNNCSTFSRACLDAELFETSTDFKGVTLNQLTKREPFTALISLITDGHFNKSEVLTYNGVDSVTPSVQEWIRADDTFPESVCDTWCPVCNKDVCSNMSTEQPFDGDFVYIPGDIVIAAFLPLSSQWDKLSEDAICSGLNVDANYDVISEAFLFAIQSAKDRQPTFLPNASFGALLFDSCTDRRRAMQVLTNFESCSYNFETDLRFWKPTPLIVPAYLTFDKNNDVAGLESDKLILQVDGKGRVVSDEELVYDPTMYSHDAVLSMLEMANWTNIGVLSSPNLTNFDAKDLLEAANARNICVQFHHTLSEASTTMADVLNKIQDSDVNTVLVYATSSYIDDFFRRLTSRQLLKTWIVVESRDNWVDLSSIPIPLGTIFFELQHKQNEEFNAHLRDLLTNNITLHSSYNTWLARYANARGFQSRSQVLSDVTTLMQASDVIRAVDILLNAVSKASNNICGNNMTLCPGFLSESPTEVRQELRNVMFKYEGATVELSTKDEMLGNYDISSLQVSNMLQVGQWVDQQLTADLDLLKSYNSIGEALPELRKSYCVDEPCVCLNINASSDDSMDPTSMTLDHEMGYVDSTAEFKSELWKIIVVIIAGSGAFITVFVLIYFLCKVCGGTLMRRYLLLGIPLLIAMMFLFLAVLPFVFTPSESVCGMRYFAHGFSYTLCFGAMLSKMMSVRSYSLIGLGGEVSRINTLFMWFFAISVQVAIGVQWWILRKPVLFSTNVFEVRKGNLEEITYYACDFQRKDFVAYHSYVIFLLVLCCIYSLSLKSLMKNNKEVSSNVLIICSWFCLALWIALIVTLLVLDRDYLEAICAIGLLANALAVLVIIFLPTLTAVSRLKYEVASAGGRREENGYKLDPDFRFERPYSLPGTLHSSITDKTLTYPRSLATFDTSLSY